MHPLSPDLTNLTAEELHQKHAELQNRMSFAYKIGNGDMVQQLVLLIGDYDMEVQRRNQEIMDQIEKKSKNFGNIINISR